MKLPLSKSKSFTYLAVKCFFKRAELFQNFLWSCKTQFFCLWERSQCVKLMPQLSRGFIWSYFWSVKFFLNRQVILKFCTQFILYLKHNFLLRKNKKYIDWNCLFPYQKASFIWQKNDFSKGQNYFKFFHDHVKLNILRLLERYK